MARGPGSGNSRGLTGRLAQTARELAQRALTASPRAARGDSIFGHPPGTDLVAALGSGLRRLTPADDADVTAMLAVAPAANAYLLGQLARGALGDESVAGTVLGAFHATELLGVACVGSNLVLSDGFPVDFMTDLVQRVAATRWVVRVIVGPDDIVSAYLDAARVPSQALEVDRRAQILFEVDAASLAPVARSAELRPALPHEFERLVGIDLAMVREELGFDPFSRDLAGYRRAWERRIAERRAWVVAPLAGPIQFKVDQAAVAPHAIQLAGVYTAPSERGRGLATRALGEMCHILLRGVPSVSLYVNAANLPAIRLYETLGFREVGRVRTAWYR